MNTFLTRTLTGVVFVAVVVLSIFFHIAAFIIVFGLISLKGLNEFYKMSEAAGASVNKIFGSILGAAVFLCICLMAAGYLPRTVWLVFFPLSSLSLIFELYRKKDTPLLNVSITIWGVLYVVVPLALISFLLFPPFSISYNPWFVLQILVLIWIYDSLAYVAGRFLGKHKLFERISPKKTLEGAIGGAVFTIAAAIYMASVDLFLDTIDWIFIAVTVVVAGTFGDLFESLLKRSVSIKDSGNIMPGHGGILDRFDAVLITIPFIVAYIYLRYS